MGSPVDIDRYLERWTLGTKLGIFFFTFACSFIGGTMGVYFLAGGNTLVAPQLTPVYTLIILFLWLGYPILLAWKGFDVVVIIFKKVGHSSFLEFNHYVKLFGYFLLLLGVISFISMRVDVFAVILLLAPIRIALPFNLTDEGKTRIQVEIARATLNDWDKRQKWLDLVLSTLETKLKRGCIDVPRDILIEQVNMILETGKPQNSVNDLLDWISGDRRDKGIVSILDQIIPHSEIKPFKRRKLRESAFSIISWADKNKNFVLTITLLFLLLVSPELKDIILQILRMWKG